MPSFLKSALWSVGHKIRNPHFLKHFEDLKSSEYDSIEVLQNLQFGRLKATLEFAKANSQFYHEIFQDVSFDPDHDFNSLEDIRFLPTFCKEQLIARNIDIHSRRYTGRVFYSETSGSSGQSLKFRKDENWDSFNRAARARGFSWYGVNLWDRNGYLWGYNFSSAGRFKTALMDSLQNRFRIFSYREEEITRFAKDLADAEYICGYSSMIHEVARKINQNTNIEKPSHLKMVCGTSEKIYEAYQNESIQAFGKKIIGEYGAAEAGIIAFECPFGSMHVNMEGVFVEEEEGEIIVTNLVARSFPVIRYRLGDYIKLKDSSYECPCGMKHQVIESVLGRVGKSVYGRSDTYPSLTFYYIFKNLAVNHRIELNYQAVQDIKGDLVIKIQQELTTDEITLLKKELHKYFDDDMSCHVITGQKLHLMNGKFIDFISTIE